MRKIVFILTIALLSFSTVAQTSEGPKGLAEIAEALRGTDDAKVLKDLRPSKKDVAAIFNDGSCQETIMNYIDKMYGAMEGDVINPRAKYTDLIYFSENTSTFINGESHNFPGGFNGELKSCFKENIDVHLIKYVEPGMTSGFSLNCFIFVNEHWILIPKPYRAFN